MQRTAIQPGRAHADDYSDSIIEGGLEPRLGDHGKPYFAVVATSMVNQPAQNEKKLPQLRDQFAQAEEVTLPPVPSTGEILPKRRPRKHNGRR